MKFSRSGKQHVLSFSWKHADLHELGGVRALDENGEMGFEKRR